MCNDFGNEVPIAEIAAAMREIDLPLIKPAAAPNLEPRADIWPTEQAAVLRRHGAGVELANLRWGFEPGNPKARAVINFRSEGRSFANSRRCLVPASHFFEFKGVKPPKSKFKFTMANEPWFCFAGLWRPAQDSIAESFTLLTTSPGPDVAPIHNRQMVVLGREQWRAWLDLSSESEELLKPLPAGSLKVEQVR